MAANLRFLNPSTMSKPPGYTHVVEATGPNRLIYIAGQLGLEDEVRPPQSDGGADGGETNSRLQAGFAA
jgi:enamine deaminase RidA (YjgF/YER057c/UK114 family)